MRQQRTFLFLSRALTSALSARRYLCWGSSLRWRPEERARAAWFSRSTSGASAQPRVSRALSWDLKEPQDTRVAVGPSPGPPTTAFTGATPIPIPHTEPQAAATRTTPGPGPQPHRPEAKPPTLTHAWPHTHPCPHGLRLQLTCTRSADRLAPAHCSPYELRHPQPSTHLGLGPAPPRGPQPHTHLPQRSSAPGGLPRRGSAVSARGAPGQQGAP